MNKYLLIAKVNCCLCFKKAIILPLFIIVVAISANAQVSTNYNFSESFGNTYTPITGGTLLAGTNTSTFFNATAPVNVVLPFTFYYNNALVTSVTVYDNGFITFGNTVTSVAISTSTPISNTIPFQGAVACFATNLGGDSATSEVSYETTGGALNRVFVIQYKDLRRRNGLANTLGTINMQIRLNEFDNSIEVIYKDQFSSTSTTTTLGQVGLRGATNGDFNNRKFKTGNNIWPSTDPGTANTDGLTVKGDPNLLITDGWKAGTKFVWSPCFAPTNINANLLVDNTTANFSWTAPSIPPAGGYDWEVRTSGNPGTGLGLFASGNTTANTVSVPGLQAGVTYYIYVKSNCSSNWSPVNVGNSTISVSPTCPLGTFPYSQDFESVTAPAIPNCNSVINSGTTLVTVDRNVTPLGGFTNKNLVSSGALASNSWYFTQQIPLPAAGYYKLSYKYGGTNASATQKMKVAYGTVNTQAGMTTVIADHNSIKTSPLTNTVNFYVPSAGNYYIGFNAYADATQGSLQLDDIYLDVTTCNVPSALTSSQVGATSANINWAAPASAPSGGYEYYITTAGATTTAGSFTVGALYQILTVGTTSFTGIGASADTVGVYFTATGAGSGNGTAVLVNTPINTTPPTGATNAGILLTSLTGLTSSTTYYFWVRSNCEGGDISAWAATPGSFTTAFQPVLACNLNTPPTVSTTYINNITTTSGVTNISNSSGLSTNGYGDYTNFVVSSYPGQTVNFSVGISGISVGVAVWVDWNNDGTFQAGERIANTTTYTSITPYSGTVTVPGAQANGEYRMRFLIDYWKGNPNNPCLLVTGIDNTLRGEVEDYTFKVITAPPALTLSSNGSSQCPGLNSPLVTITAGLTGTPATVYQSFSWSPSTGVRGSAANGYTFNSTSTVTYTLTASQTVFPFSVATATYTYTVNTAPTALVVTPSSASLCGAAASAVQLVATGGIVAGVVALSENFNTGATGWTTAASSSGGTPANANWTIRNSGYNPGGSSGISSLVSNDNSSFYVSNSDSQGSAGTTDVQLISPSFSLANYTNASLSFYHHVRPFNSAYYAKVEIFSGGSWTALQTWVYNNGTQGTPINFAQVTINLNAYIGQTGLQIRFNYYDKWGYVWAVDNVEITGTSSPPSITWTPNGIGSGLFTDAGATVVYSGGNASTVYAKPSNSQTYTATVTASSGCKATDTAIISSFPITMGTASANQSISCSVPLTNISVTSFTGSSIYWEYTDDSSLLTGWTTIPASNSITLTTTQIGSLTNTRYFRAVATNGTCTLNSTVITVTTLNKATWNGSSWSNGSGPDATITAEFNGNFDSSLNSSGSINACSVSILSGNVIIKSGHTLNVQKSVQVNTPGTLTFEDSASLVQVLTTDNGVPITNSGNIIYKRTTTPMINFDYSYWSAPVSGQEIHAFSPLTLSDKFYLWDTGPSYNWLSLPSSYNMIAGTGYIIRAPQGWSSSPTSWTGTFIGVPNNGDISTPIVVTGPNNMNLIGNPYPCSLNADLFLNDPGNTSKIQGSIYLWTHNTPISGGSYTSNDYAVWNKFGATGTRPALNSGINNNLPNGHVAAGNAFFVEGITSGNVTFKNAMREAGYNSFFFKTNTPKATASFEKHRLWLEISNDMGLFKQILLGYAQDATSGRDRNYDAIYLDAGNPLSIYSIIGQDYLTIKANGLPFNVQDIHQLGYSATNAGAYKIEMPMFDGLFEGQVVYLEDKLLNVIHDLKQGTYNFTTEAGTFNDRFVLRFTTTALGNPQFNVNSVIVYKNEQGLHVTTGNIVMKSVNIYDVAGRLITSQNNISDSEIVFTNLPKTQQVLLVKITSITGVTVTKKVVY